MSSFHVYNPTRFTKEFGERYMGAIFQASFGYEAAPKLEKLAELTREHQEEKQIDPVSDTPPTRYEDCSQLELAILLVFMSLAADEKEAFMMLIRWLTASKFAKLN